MQEIESIITILDTIVCLLWAAAVQPLVREPYGSISLFVLVVVFMYVVLFFMGFIMFEITEENNEF